MQQNPHKDMQRSEQVFEDFRRGNIDSLYREHYSSMMAYAARYLKNDYAMMAEDCVQEAVIKTYNNRENFSSPFQMKSYLFTCIHNGCISVLRKVNTHQQFLAIPPNEVEQEFTASLIEQETLDLLYAAIDELPEKYRQVFELNFIQGLKNAEVAELLNISINGFNKRKAKMISLLRDRFKDNPRMLVVITILAGI